MLPITYFEYIDIQRIILSKFSLTGLELSGDHHCGGEIFQSIFIRIGWKYSEKSLLHSDDRLLFPALLLCVVISQIFSFLA